MTPANSITVKKILERIQPKTLKILKTARNAKHNPIITVTLKENAYSLAIEHLTKCGVDKEIIDGLFSPENIIQLEALGRIFILGEDLKFRSVLFNNSVFGVHIGKEIVDGISDYIIDMATGYEPFICGGVSYGKGRSKITITKYDPPVNKGSDIHNFLEDMFTAMADTEELKVLEHIYENEVASFKNKRKRDKFIYQMETIKHLKNHRDELPDAQVYRIYWQNPWIETFMLTGLWGGVAKLRKASDGNLHAVKNAFIVLYDKAK